MRMILYHSGEELITDWPAIFRRKGFSILEAQDILPQTMPTWDHAVAVYSENAEVVDRRYGKKNSRKAQEQLRRIPGILKKYGSFVVLSLQK